MKRIIFFLLCSSIFIELKAQKKGVEKKFVLKGKIMGQDTGFVSLTYLSASGKIICDTLNIKNSNFYFSGRINEPTCANFSSNVKSKSNSDFNTLIFFLEPSNIKLIVKLNDFVNAKISGSHAQGDLDVLHQQEASILKLMEPLEKRFSKKKEEYMGTNNDSIKKYLDKKLVEIESMLNLQKEKIRQKEYAFMIAHPASYISPYLMQYYLSRLPLDSIKEVYNNWQLDIQKSRYGQLVKKEINKKEWNTKGSAAQYFLAEDINGNEVSLSSFKNKSYVLLDFWASWCAPCRKANPDLIQVYKKYHLKGLDIIGISYDTDKNAWIEAIKKDSTDTWYNILVAQNLQKTRNGEINENDIIEKYEILYLPTQILIDKEGIIIAKWDGQGKENKIDLERTLFKIFE